MKLAKSKINFRQDTPVLNRFSRSEGEEKVQELLTRAGFSSPTPLQQKLLPLILQGKDLLVETLGSRGKRTAICLAAILRGNYAEPGTKTLIITSRESDIAKIHRQFEKFESFVKERTLAPLGLEKNPKKELQYIRNNPDLIIGTTERIIDHLRRDNIELQDIELLIISTDAQREHEGFIQDILFISSKIENLQQRVIFSSVIAAADSLQGMLHRPQILSFHDWNTQDFSHLAYITGEGKEKPGIVKSLYFADSLANALIVAKNNAQAVSLSKKLESFGVPCKTVSSKQANRDRKTNSKLGITTFKTLNTLPYIDFRTILFYQVPFDPHRYATTMGKIKNTAGETTLISLVLEKEQKFIERIKEEHGVEIKENSLPQEKHALIQKKIENIIKTIKEDENPEVMDTYKKMVKKHVPFPLRAYFTAYLLKNSLEGERDESYTTLFVSVGKNRKVFPKDLSRLFTGAIKVEPTDIGQIRILDNYSFIDVPSGKAQAAIDALNGKEFRGRKITVNYARKKEDKSS